MKIVRKTFEKYYGFIDYHYSIEEKHPHGILVFLGSLIYKKFRGNGLFKPMIEEFLSKFPQNTEVHLTISNKKILGLFKDLGFIETKEPLEFWGNPSNALNLKKIL